MEPTLDATTTPRLTIHDATPLDPSSRQTCQISVGTPNQVDCAPDRGARHLFEEWHWPMTVNDEHERDDGGDGDVGSRGAYRLVQMMLGTIPAWILKCTYPGP